MREGQLWACGRRHHGLRFGEQPPSYESPERLAAQYQTRLHGLHLLAFIPGNPPQRATTHRLRYLRLFAPGAAYWTTVPLAGVVATWGRRSDSPLRFGGTA